jgi:hypothetical protein
MKNTLLLAALVTTSSAALAQTPTLDLYTMSCVQMTSGLPDTTELACGQLYPPMAPKLKEARAAWEARNQAGLAELKEACQARVRKVYGDDAAKLASAVEQAKQFQSRMVADVVAHPNGRIDCRAYVEDSLHGSPRIDNLKDMITTVRSQP